MNWGRRQITNSDYWSQLENVSGWIRHSDAKLTTIIAFIGVSGAGLYVVAQEAHGEWSRAILALAAGALVVAGVTAFFGLLPRRRYRPGAQRDRIYYRAITRQFDDAAEYSRELRGLDESVIQDDLARQIFANAKVADRKFALASQATIALATAVALLVLATALVTFDGWFETSNAAPSPRSST
jgi:hypothetical protein